MVGKKVMVRKKWSGSKPVRGRVGVVLQGIRIRLKNNGMASDMDNNSNI